MLIDVFVGGLICVAWVCFFLPSDFLLLLSCHPWGPKMMSRKIKAPDLEEQLAAFRMCPQLPPERGRELLPELMEVSELLAQTQSVGWQWGCFPICVGAGAMVPDAWMVLTPSCRFKGGVWVSLLHPGAVNSSGVIKMTSGGVHRVFERLYTRERAAAAAAGDPPPKKRRLLAGGGSLAAMGLQMSAAENRGAALSVEPEIEGIFANFAAESVVDRGVPGKLWDSTTWDRPVLATAKAFAVESPFDSMLAAGHIPEHFRALREDDFGYRQRLTASFQVPLWLTINEIRDACLRLPVPSHNPEDFLAGLWLPLLVWGLKPENAGAEFAPCVTDGAQELVDAKFNYRMQKQSETFLEPGLHEESRSHGKLRTKFDRMSLAVHFGNAVATYYKRMRSRVPPVEMHHREYVESFSLSLQVPLNVCEFAYWWAEHCEQVWLCLDLNRGASVSDMADDGATERGPVEPDVRDMRAPRPTVDEVPVVSGQQLLEVEARLRTHPILDARTLNLILFMRVEALAELLSNSGSVLTPQLLLALAHEVMQCPFQWVWFTMQTRQRNLFREAAARHGDNSAHFSTLMACRWMQWCGLGKVVLSSPISGGGRRSWYYVKRPMAIADCESDIMQRVLLMLGVVPAGVLTPAAYCVTTTHANAPQRAPEVVWDVIDQEYVPAALQLLQIDQGLARGSMDRFGGNMASPVEAGMPSPHVDNPNVHLSSRASGSHGSGPPGVPPVMDRVSSSGEAPGAPISMTTDLDLDLQRGLLMDCSSAVVQNAMRNAFNAVAAAAGNLPGLRLTLALDERAEARCSELCMRLEQLLEHGDINSNLPIVNNIVTSPPYSPLYVEIRANWVELAHRRVQVSILYSKCFDWQEFCFGFSFDCEVFLLLAMSPYQNRILKLNF